MSSIPRTYRSVLREMNKMAIQPRPTRNKPLYTLLRSIFSYPSPDVAKWEGQMREMRDYLRAARLHSELLARYNPTHDMTTDERVHATARRVGLDQPIQYKKGDE